MIVTRFAPSPTGLLHIGHVYSLVCSYEFAKKNNGKFILRIEDIDFTRCKNLFIEQIIDDINWLKIPFKRTNNQSLRTKQYSKALDNLKDKDLVYACWLTRKEASSTLNAPHNQISQNAKKILEIGFNGGHSAETFLKSSENVIVHSVDIGFHHYVKFGYFYLKKKYKDRIKIHFGDSTQVLPKLIRDKEQFDFVFIDGGHDYDIVKTDLFNSLFFIDSFLDKKNNNATHKRKRTYIRL